MATKARKTRAKTRNTTKGKTKATDAPTKHASVRDETRRGAVGIALLVLGVLFLLAAFDSAGRVGEVVYALFHNLFGVGYYLVPASLTLLSVAIFRSLSPLRDGHITWVHSLSSVVLFVSALALIETAHTGAGGLVGTLLSAPLVSWLAVPATVIVLLAIGSIAFMILFDTHPHIPHFSLPGSDDADADTESEQEPTQMKIRAPMMKDAQQRPTTESTAPLQKVKQAALTIKNAATDKQGKSDDKDELSLEVKTISGGDYTPPPMNILRKNSGKPIVGDVKANANQIRRTLKNFGIIVEMDEVSIGPTVTRYALKPAEGVRLNKIVSLQSNLELALAASPVRIEAPIPGKALVGIEVPNRTRTTLGLRTMFSNPEYAKSDKPLLAALGGDISGKAYFVDIAKMPHVLIAGATGAGKSVTVHDVIVSLLYRSGPNKLRLLMVDPKRVELTLYNKIPHLLTPVITDAKNAILALKWLTKEMDRRYDVLQQEAVRDIGSYHKNVLEPALKKKKAGKLKEDEKMPEDMPYIVAFIDELSDLMQAYPRELEAAIVRLTQMSRAVGIHLVLATQRPSVQVITGLIKANVPTRIALQVASQVDSRTILDTGGAEKLLGKGDMLYLGGEMSKPVRLQAPFISEEEVKKVAEHLRKLYESELDDAIDLSETEHDDAIFSASVFDNSAGDEEDDLYEEAKRIVIEAGKGSTSYIQRKLRVGYNRAARLMDMLEERGIVGPADGAKPRQVIYTPESTDADTADAESMV